MSQISSQSVVDLFKRVYGDLKNLLPENFILEREIPYSSTARVGDRYVIAVILTNETGWTIAGTGQEAFDINPAVAGVVKQAEIIPSQTLLSSVIPFAFITRSVGSEQAFYDGTKHVMKNHLKSHSKLLEIIRLYGQSTELLGYVSFAPSGTVYRGATYSGAGDVTLTLSDGSTIAFTDGVNAASKAILLAPGQFAAGIWVGTEGARILEVDANAVIVGSGKLVGIDADLGILYVDFAPVAATSVTSHRICFEGMEQAKDAVGMHKIITNTGSLFGISAATYSLWRGNVFDLGNKRFDLKAMQLGIALAVNRGGLDAPLLTLCNPRTWANLSQDEASLRKYDASYTKDAKNGFEAIEYYAANGLNIIMAHPMVKEGHVFGIQKSSWIRSGSAQISFKIPGIDREVIFPLENQAGWMIRSFADMFLLCEEPAKQILWKNANDEGVAY